MILADTSAWVEYDRATGSAVDRRVTDLISTDAPIVATEPVLMEVLAGAQDGRRADSLRRLLLRGGLLPFETPTDFEGAVSIYHQCRAAGITPRGMVDCMIAAVAHRRRAALLCRDVDLERIANVMKIDLDEASRADDAKP